DRVIQTAIKDRLPIRVIVLDGERRDIKIHNVKPSRVNLRLLDPVGWHVAEYNEKTGACKLKRGIVQFVNNFSIPKNFASPPVKKIVTGEVFVRSREVRQKALVRATGKCE